MTIKKAFGGHLRFQKVRVCDHYNGTWQYQAGVVLKQMLGAHILKHNPETEISL